MDPKTPPCVVIDLEEEGEEEQEEEVVEVMRKRPRIVVKRAAAPCDEEPRPAGPQKRKRRMQQFCYSSGSEDEEEEPKAVTTSTEKNLRRKAWIDYHDSDSETEGLSQEKICDDELPLGVIQGRAGSNGFQLIMTKYRGEAGRAPNLDPAPVFFPTEEEFQDTLKYIEKIRPLVEPYGICRVVPPKSWRPPCSLKDNAGETVRFSTRVQKIHKLQVREPTTSSHGKKSRPKVSKILTFTPQAAQQQEFFGFEPGPSFTIKEFEAYADELKEKYFQAGEEGDTSRLDPSVEQIEREFWRIVERPSEQIEARLLRLCYHLCLTPDFQVLYGADIETNVFKSGFPKLATVANKQATPYETSGWNLNNIARLKGSVLEFEADEISGVVVPWLYVGMCFSSFCWHVEDHHLYSVNYMHWGSPKIWYGVPGFAASKLEAAMKKRLPALFKEQPDLLHKLVTQLSPSILAEEGVPVYKVVQNTGEFVITFPRAYHAGFNCGFNCAEAVNVAPVNWLPHGQSAVETYKEQHRKTSISHDKLLLASVKQELAEVSASVTHRQILASALKARLNLESSRRAAVNDLRAQTMDVNFDSSAERECCVCSYDLHLSAAACQCSPDLYSCLDHVKSFCSCTPEKKLILYRHELSELEEFLRELEGRPLPPLKFKIHGPRPELNRQLVDPSSGLESSRSWEAACGEVLNPAPGKGLMVVEPRSGGGPRVARVIRPSKAFSPNIELVRTGRLVLKPGWHTKHAILPAGFRTRVQFYDYLDLPQACYYMSEILDCADGKPLFKVSMEGRPHEKIVCSSIDFCWQSVQEKVNSRIKQLRESGKANLPPLRPPESLKGLEMFGFTVPSVVKAVETLDPRHSCVEYWMERKTNDLWS
ncbi:lysine-specific demethylase JMJ703 isoform X1 [Selaginella moellendorffii]|uniref:lysine-specific demethylase JMJ703 isoform X1 n=1 Tax=Selaginella moellendorffii TaxID=88036 RepID=UPI000D1C6288|nr:lysine-specific demethylase JMJ703 isoform X1 [Selaginella moellendorffii]|eukprot:XP_024529682.1 lysine-specific demethylase JMJ703 isoform X1 [Selaginella moellendorffii]